MTFCDRDNTTVYRVGAVRDAAGADARPAAVVVRGGQIVAAGPIGEAARGVDGATVVELPDTLVLPALVNAHAHLDLTTLGPRPYGGQFADWLAEVIRQAPAGDSQVARSVARGLAMCAQAGTGYLGDITGNSAAITARLSDGKLPGVSYLECFGVGARQDDAIAHLKDQVSRLGAIDAMRGFDAPSGTPRPLNPAVRLGIQPHAPYSAGLDLYAAAADLAAKHGYRLSTHLAETPQEIRFVRDGDGPLADLLRAMGKWDDTLGPTGLHPVEWLEPVLERGPWLLAHCNYVDDRHIEILARVGASVAYCPIASDYFGHHQSQRGVYHRYRDMLQAGVNVCLGTDSIVCHPVADLAPMSMGSQMRYLYRRDGFDPATLLAMATVNGMNALGLPAIQATLQPGAAARFVGVRIDPADPTDPLIQALKNNEPMTFCIPIEHLA